MEDSDDGDLAMRRLTIFLTSFSKYVRHFSGTHYGGEAVSSPVLPHYRLLRSMLRTPYFRRDFH